MSQRVKVGILGQEYTIYTQADKAYAEEVARYVASKCQEAQRSLRSSSVGTIAVLAALNIASDYVQTKKAYEQLLARIESKQEKLADLEL
ncbi:MAG: cell division protein ZapA [Syntrophobacteria bacterium]